MEKDQGWAWVVLCATFMAVFINTGLVLNNGIYFVSFLEAFNEARSYTAWIGGVSAATFHLTGFISSIIVSRIGPRWVVIFGGLLYSLCYALLFKATSVLYIIMIYGIIGGFGSFLTLSGSIATLPLYFEKRMYLASGVTFGGGGLGIAVVGLLMEFLIERFGWRGSLLLVSGISLQVCVCGALIFNTGKKIPNNRALQEKLANTLENSEKGSDENTNIKFLDINCTDAEQHAPNESTSDIKLYFCDIKFWLLAVSFCGMVMSSLCGFTFFKDIMIQEGHGSSFKLFLMSLGLGSGIGRIAAGFISNYFSPVLCFAWATSLNAINITLFMVASDSWIFLVIGFIFGAGHGAAVVFHNIMIVSVYGNSKMPKIWAWLMALGSIGVLVGPPMGGLIADATGNYIGTIIMTSVIMLMSGLFSLGLHFVQRKKHQNNEICSSDVNANLDETGFSPKELYQCKG